MSEELQNPPVVDLDLILSPISEESPSGADLKYTGIYDEIREARRADEALEQGAWQTELKVADFQKALNVAVDALTTKTKDIQIAAWLCEALVKTHGFIGFRDGLKILVGLQERFWETMFPEIDEGDMESRANAIGWVDAQVSQAIKTAPFTGAAGYSYNDWQDSQKFDFPDNVDSVTGDEGQRLKKLKEQAETERRVTSDLWRKEIAQTRRASMESVNNAIVECWDTIKQLDAVIEAKYDRNQAPGLAVLKKSLEDVHAQVNQILNLKRAEEPDEILEEAGEMEGDGAGPAGGSRQAEGGSGELRSRRDALKRLAEIADFFKRTEPHSPVSYLVQKAVKWGDMPLDSWLQEVVKDPGTLFQLRETLGVSSDIQ
jgi:type VI secretion system protein ImpA